MNEDPAPRLALASRLDFHAALRRAFETAADARALEIVLCDPDFADWPLGERAVVDALARWAAPRRRLQLLAGGYDQFACRHARWVEWRRAWSHLVECRVNEEIEAAQLPSLCLVPGIVAVRLLDPVHHRGYASGDASDVQACREAIDAVSQRSMPAFPSTTLGL
jgi:hypothetical protein